MDFSDFAFVAAALVAIFWAWSGRQANRQIEQLHKLIGSEKELSAKVLATTIAQMKATTAGEASAVALDQQFPGIPSGGELPTATPARQPVKGLRLDNLAGEITFMGDIDESMLQDVPERRIIR